MKNDYLNQLSNLLKTPNEIKIMGLCLLLKDQTTIWIMIKYQKNHLDDFSSHLFNHNLISLQLSTILQSTKRKRELHSISLQTSIQKYQLIKKTFYEGKSIVKNSWMLIHSKTLNLANTRSKPIHYFKRKD